MIRLLFLVLLFFSSLQAQVVFENQHQTFDTIFSGEVIRSVFYFRNEGEKPIGIERLRGSCGCTTLEGPKDSIPPGGRDSFMLEFRTKDRSGRQVKKAYLRLAANEPELSPVTLSGTLLVPRLTQTFSKQTFQLDSQGKDSLTLTSYGVHSVYLDSVVSSCPALDVRAEQKEIKPGYYVMVHLAQRSNKRLRCRKQPVITFYFSGYLGETHMEQQFGVISGN